MADDLLSTLGKASASQALSMHKLAMLNLYLVLEHWRLRMPLRALLWLKQGFISLSV